MNKLFNIVKEVDLIFNQALEGNNGIIEKLDKILLELSVFEDVSVLEQDEQDLIMKAIRSISSKVDLIYKVLNIRVFEITLEDLKSDFVLIEKMRFEIINKYVMGIIRVDDVESFKKNLFDFRKKLYAIPISDSNIIEVAKMKSKVQHFNTEVLEDEEVLRVAYSNSN